jgi:hypothetical protein
MIRVGLRGDDLSSGSPCESVRHLLTGRPNKGLQPSAPSAILRRRG